jgi:hypothetical protein
MHVFQFLRVSALFSLVFTAPSGAQESVTAPSRLKYFSFDLEKPIPSQQEADVCIYGATSAGVIAAVQLKRLGKSVILLEPSDHVGGLSSGGLSFTDIGNKKAIGGLSREFYKRCGQKYGVEEEWRFEPKVAEQVFLEMLQEAQIPVAYRSFLQEIEVRNKRIEKITTRAGATIRAKMWIDCTYEGDLMARAGVPFRQGREGNYEFNETVNGVQTRDKHQFLFPVDPYVEAGNPDSGLLPYIDPTGPIPDGTGDLAIQAYNFRLCLTKDPANKLPWPKPENYNKDDYALLERYIAAGFDNFFYGIVPLRNGKFDMNNAGAVSTDFIGANHEYPGGDYVTREKIFQNHVNYQQGLLWYLANEPNVPEKIRNRISEYGLCKDEFVETGGWPHQLYVREARRMVSDYIMSEHNCRSAITAPDPVGLAAYTMDSHNCRRFVKDGKVMNEGDVQVGGFPPYPISYRSLIPRKGDCPNLFVPVCLATTHIAYGSIRMEPVFMILGQSSALAASIALDKNLSVQDVPYPELRKMLEEGGQILAWEKP